MKAFALLEDGALVSLSSKGVAAFAPAAVAIAQRGDEVIVARPDGVGALSCEPTAIAVSGDDVWVTDRNGFLLHLPSERFAIPPGPVLCAAGPGWVAYAFDDGRLHVRIGNESEGLVPLPSAPSALICCNDKVIVVLHEGLLVSFHADQPDRAPFTLVTPRFVALRGDLLLAEDGVIHRLVPSGGVETTEMRLPTGADDFALDSEGAYLLRESEISFHAFSEAGFGKARVFKAQAQRLFVI